MELRQYKREVNRKTKAIVAKEKKKFVKSLVFKGLSVGVLISGIVSVIVAGVVNQLTDNVAPVTTKEMAIVFAVVFVCMVAMIAHEELNGYKEVVSRKVRRMERNII